MVRYLFFCSNVLAPFVRIRPFVRSAIPRHCLPEKELPRKNVAVPELIDGVFLGEKVAPLSERRSAIKNS